MALLPLVRGWHDSPARIDLHRLVNAMGDPDGRAGNAVVQHLTMTASSLRIDVTCSNYLAHRGAHASCQWKRRPARRAAVVAA